MKAGNITIEFVRGSVTDQDVDAIVNAANTGMRGGGGIDGRIHALAWPGLLTELVRSAPHGAKTGEPVVTSGHSLPQKYVVHVAGPRWNGGDRGEAEQLRACYFNSLSEASKLGATSIAFCTIATGIYGYPIEQAAKLAIETAIIYAREHKESSLRRVAFALYGEHEFDVFQRAYSVEAGESN